MLCVFVENYFFFRTLREIAALRARGLLSLTFPMRRAAVLREQLPIRPVKALHKRRFLRQRGLRQRPLWRRDCRRSRDRRS